MNDKIMGSNINNIKKSAEQQEEEEEEKKEPGN